MLTGWTPRATRSFRKAIATRLRIDFHIHLPKPSFVFAAGIQPHGTHAHERKQRRSTGTRVSRGLTFGVMQVLPITVSGKLAAPHHFPTAIDRSSSPLIPPNSIMPNIPDVITVTREDGRRTTSLEPTLYSLTKLVANLSRKGKSKARYTTSRDEKTVER